MSVSEVRKGLDDFCETWKMFIPALKENYMVEPLLNRKINLGVGQERFTLTLTSTDAFISDGEDPFAHALFATDPEGWSEMLRGESNFLSLSMQKRMETRMDEALIHMRLGIIIQLLMLMRSPATEGE